MVRENSAWGDQSGMTELDRGLQRVVRGEPSLSATANKIHRSLHPSTLPTLERVTSQKKAHTVFFLRRNHIIWVYRNGVFVCEVGFLQGSHLDQEEIGNSYAGTWQAWMPRMLAWRCEPVFANPDSVALAVPPRAFPVCIHTGGSPSCHVAQI